MGMTNRQFKSHTRLVINDLDEMKRCLEEKELEDLEKKLDKLRSALQAALED